MPPATIGSPTLWIGFLLFVLCMLALDLGVFHRRAHAVTLSEAGAWSAVWVMLALIFNLGVWHWHGTERALEFGAGYLIEKALSVDNIFVFVIIFGYFRIPAAHQHRVLFWGILGALGSRAAFILMGGAFLRSFHWAIYVFGGVLALTGIRLMLERKREPHPERNPVVRLLRRLIPTTDALHGSAFLAKVAGRRFATPLLLALLTVEVTDVVFAIDSIPAVFAVTSDSFIVFTSNIFAILGLRSLYFLLAGVVDRFAHLKLGLALILVFVGAKMLVSELYQVPIGVSLAVIAVLLGGSIVTSLLASSAAAARLQSVSAKAPCDPQRHMG
ncbi:MAG: TerC family protein [Planctomycetota bacterium]